MFSMLLAVSVGAAPASGAIDRTGQGRVVVSCAAAGDVLVDGKRRSRCKEDTLKAAFWVDAGTHKVVVAAGGGAEAVFKTVLVVEGKTVRVNLSGAVDPTGGVDGPAGSVADEPDDSVATEVEAIGSPAEEVAPPAVTPPFSPPSVVGSSPEPGPVTPGPIEPGARPRSLSPATSSPTAVAPAVRHHFVDRGDGTVADTESGLMWVKKDSYAELDRCLNPYQAATYVQFLTTGGHRDWRLPTALELATLAGDSTGVFAHDRRTPLYLDAVFGDRASVRAWTAEQSYRVGTALGLPTLQLTVYDYARRTTDVRPYWGACLGTGVRAVRNAGR